MLIIVSAYTILLKHYIDEIPRFDYLNFNNNFCWVNSVQLMEFDIKIIMLGKCILIEFYKNKLKFCILFFREFSDHYKGINTN